MQQISATDAKQTFGDLLDAAARGPVAIEKYKKIKAIVAAPEFFARASQEQARLAERHMARLQQSLLDKDRFIQHQQIAVKLLTLPARERRALIEKAQAVVAQWQAERLCSSDYIDKWQALLRLPAPELARALASDADGWGPALRQNSPWPGLAP